MYVRLVQGLHAELHEIRWSTNLHQDSENVSWKQWPLSWVLENALKFSKRNDQEDCHEKIQRSWQQHGTQEELHAMQMATPTLSSLLSKKLAQFVFTDPLTLDKTPKRHGDCFLTTSFGPIKVCPVASPHSAMQWPVWGCSVISALTYIWQILKLSQEFSHVDGSFCSSSFPDLEVPTPGL